MTDWQPINTAPQDGSRILLYWPTLFNQPHVACGTWQTQRYHVHPRPFWQSDYRWGIERLRDCPPTYWMPLPEPPQEGE